MYPTRDFRGYAGRPPAIRWPDDARLAVSVVVNVEEGAELALSAGDERNESVYEVQEEIVGVPDPCMESHFEYGTRAGWPRIRALLMDYGVAATLNANGRALALSPWLAQEGVADGHEVAAHGWRWERHAHMSEAEERSAIARTVAAITAASGAPPRGWHTRSATSPNTRRLLLEQGGFLYDSNAYNDDLPYLTDVGGIDHLVLPYAFDTNDMRFTRNGGFVFGDDFAHYCIDAFDRLHAEGGQAPRMMSVGLHLRIIGRPGRIGGLERFLAHVASKSGVWFARRDQIARHWLEATGRQDILARVLGPTAV
ncbi:polysaccharide deacetylase family protein [Prosthecodimorpha staleyi]|uniref:Chitooligosaccharide deacetylase n=1 Tax=Prosthecodimorpha staleyi TaxID=2840188 RepID=A0A947GCE7_9HYPH|nr:polysaccharide deacetylase family protein [Prosthecodimorpha staleyi]MBT9291318.1 polysaccharide deacetylase family protein [Prosthecodimorpha staleyi]